MAREGMRLGFVGLGRMGVPITSNLLRAGHAVTVWNRSPDKLAPVLEEGAVAAASPAEVAREADITFVCVFDAAAVREVALGPKGIVEGGGAGKTLVDLSTTEVAATRAMADELRERCGMAWVDAPVTGGQRGAREGTLVVMGGGAADDVERVRPAIEAFSRRFAHMGPQGAGQVTKLCNQIAVGCTFVVVAEMLTLAQKNGVDIATLPEVLEGGFADSAILRLHAPRMIAREFAAEGQSRTVPKDFDAIVALAGTSGAGLPMTGLAHQLWRMHVARGHGDDDVASIITLYDDAG